MVRPEDEKGILDWLAEGRDKDVWGMLDKEHVDVSDIVDEEGRGILHIAVDSDNLEVVKEVLDRGVDINQVDDEGLTAIQYATICEYPEMVAYLLSRGADPLIKDDDGLTAIDNATTDEIKNMLEEFVKEIE